MVDVSKALGNNSTDLITLVQVWRQQPRDSKGGLSVLYCQQQPRNTELTGLFQCQFDGTDKNTFTGNIAAGQSAFLFVPTRICKRTDFMSFLDGTIPLGLDKAVDPAGSCPSHPDGPIPAGQHLVAADDNSTSANQSGSASSTTFVTTTSTALASIASAHLFHDSWTTPE